MNFLPQIDIKIDKNLALGANFLVDDILKKSELNIDNARICLVSDKIIWRNCQKFFDKDFIKNCSQLLILNNPQPDQKNINKIKNSLKNCNLIVAVGSGVINDLCKFVSFETKISYLIFASAASMNGYLSRNASLLINGHKKTLTATLPIAVYADLKILKSAPKKMIKAGIGDIMCFYGCWFDWLLSHLILDTKFEEKPFKILQEKMDFFCKNYYKFQLNDEQLLKNLIEILLLSGAGMTLAQGSYPASQSEHMIAHSFEMRYPKKAKKLLHGTQIAITSITIAKIQEKLVKQSNLGIFKEEFLEHKLTKFFGKKTALECKKEYINKINDKNFDINKINNELEKCWPKQRQCLEKILVGEKKLKKIFNHFKIPISHRALGLSNQEYQALVTIAKFTRNRFTCLDLDTPS